MRMLPKSRRAFTLIELLVVIAIIAILISLLLPAVQKVRDAAAKTQCANNLKQLGLAAQSYVGDHKKFPPGMVQEYLSGSNSGYQGHSVFYYILPYLEQKNLFDTMDKDKPKNNVSTVSGQRAGTVVKVFLCPSDALDQGVYPYVNGSVTEYYGATSYKANGGSRPIYATSATNDGMFMATGSRARKASSAPSGTEVRIASVTDGLSNTILFGEASHLDTNFDTFNAQGWTSGSGIQGWSRWYPAGGDVGLSNILGGAFAPINYTTPWSYGEAGAPTSRGAWYVFQDQRLSAFGSNHTGTVNMVYGDGSVHSLSENTSQFILTLLCRRNDGQPIPNE